MSTNNSQLIDISKILDDDNSDDEESGILTPVPNPQYDQTTTSDSDEDYFPETTGSGIVTTPIANYGQFNDLASFLEEEEDIPIDTSDSETDQTMTSSQYAKKNKKSGNQTIETYFSLTPFEMLEKDLINEFEKRYKFIDIIPNDNPKIKKKMTNQIKKSVKDNLKNLEKLIDQQKRAKTKTEISKTSNDVENKINEIKQNLTYKYKRIFLNFLNGTQTDKKSVNDFENQFLNNKTTKSIGNSIVHQLQKYKKKLNLPQHSQNIVIEDSDESENEQIFNQNVRNLQQNNDLYRNVQPISGIDTRNSIVRRIPDNISPDNSLFSLMSKIKIGNNIVQYENYPGISENQALVLKTLEDLILWGKMDNDELRVNRYLNDPFIQRKGKGKTKVKDLNLYDLDSLTIDASDSSDGSSTKRKRKETKKSNVKGVFNSQCNMMVYNVHPYGVFDYFIRLLRSNQMFLQSVLKDYDIFRNSNVFAEFETSLSSLSQEMQSNPEFDDPRGSNVDQTIMGNLQKKYLHTFIQSGVSSLQKAFLNQYDVDVVITSDQVLPKETTQGIALSRTIGYNILIKTNAFFSSMVRDSESIQFEAHLLSFKEGHDVNREIRTPLEKVYNSVFTEDGDNYSCIKCSNSTHKFEYQPKRNDSSSGKTTWKIKLDFNKIGTSGNLKGGHIILIKAFVNSVNNTKQLMFMKCTSPFLIVSKPPDTYINAQRTENMVIDRTCFHKFKNKAQLYFNAVHRKIMMEKLMLEFDEKTKNKNKKLEQQLLKEKVKKKQSKKNVNQNSNEFLNDELDKMLSDETSNKPESEHNNFVIPGVNIPKYKIIDMNGKTYKKDRITTAGKIYKEMRDSKKDHAFVFPYTPEKLFSILQMNRCVFNARITNNSNSSTSITFQQHDRYLKDQTSPNIDSIYSMLTNISEFVRVIDHHPSKLNQQKLLSFENIIINGNKNPRSIFNLGEVTMENLYDENGRNEANRTETFFGGNVVLNYLFRIGSSEFMNFKLGIASKRFCNSIEFIHAYMMSMCFLISSEAANLKRAHDSKLINLNPRNSIDFPIDLNSISSYLSNNIVDLNQNNKKPKQHCFGSGNKIINDRVEILRNLLDSYDAPTCTYSIGKKEEIQNCIEAAKNEFSGDLSVRYEQFLLFDRKYVKLLLHSFGCPNKKILKTLNQPLNYMIYNESHPYRNISEALSRSIGRSENQEINRIRNNERESRNKLENQLDIDYNMIENGFDNFIAENIETPQEKQKRLSKLLKEFSNKKTTQARKDEIELEITRLIESTEQNQPSQTSIDQPSETQQKKQAREYNEYMELRKTLSKGKSSKTQQKEIQKKMQKIAKINKSVNDYEKEMATLESLIYDTSNNSLEALMYYIKNNQPLTPKIIDESLEEIIRKYNEANDENEIKRLSKTAGYKYMSNRDQHDEDYEKAMFEFAIADRTEGSLERYKDFLKNTTLPIDYITNRQASIQEDIQGSPNTNDIEMAGYKHEYQIMNENGITIGIDENNTLIDMDEKFFDFDNQNLDSEKENELIQNIEKNQEIGNLKKTIHDFDER